MTFFALVAMVAINLICSLIMAKDVVIPLGRLISKTRRLRKYPFLEEDFSSAELGYDEPGEWYDLERALNKLGGELRRKTIRLSREKTELRAIMSSVAEAIVALDTQKNVLFYNTQFALLFDVQSANATSVFGLLRSPELLMGFEKTTEGQEGLRSELEIRTPSQPTNRHFLVSWSPLRKKHNREIYGAAAVFLDITDIKKAERIRIDFVGNVSHELRTPLTAIQGYAQTLEEDLRLGQSQDALQFVQIIRKNTSRLIELVTDLLDLSTIESGSSLKLQPFSVQEVTESVLQVVPHAQHDVQVTCDISEVYGDPRRVEQVIRNLLQNAVRYVPKHQKIAIRWSSFGEVDILSVKDTGPGIPVEHQERLFERFYRVDRARTREMGGAGIGLAIAKHIMQQHGGSIRVESKPGEGAEFICEFPKLKNLTNRADGIRAGFL